MTTAQSQIVRIVVASGLAASITVMPAARPAVLAPTAAPEVKFAVIGDNGTGDTPQYDIGRQMAAARANFPFEFVVMLGDNLYGRQEPRDFVDKFERPYAALLGAGIPFYATLGNHDNPDNRFYKGFNMGGERYYTFARGAVRFFVFDSNLMDPQQLAWIDDTLERSQDSWKIAVFHHPLYSDGGRHGSNVQLRVALEPLLVRHRVDAVFSGHEHIYERLQPQQGISYFIEGASGQLRKGDVTPSATTAAAFTNDQSFMLVSVAGDEMTFETISRTGRSVDRGVVRRRTTT